MKTIAAFFIVNAALFALQALAAGACYGFGQVVLLVGLGENWLAWATAGILATGGAIGVATRMVRGVA